jgi:oligopeptide transport system permease protein
MADMARIVRGQTLSPAQWSSSRRPARSAAPARRIVLRHIVPNVLGPVIVSTSTLLVPHVILVESFLSFLGLGVQEPQTSWGA